MNDNPIKLYKAWKTFASKTKKNTETVFVHVLFHIYVCFVIYLYNAAVH